MEQVYLGFVKLVYYGRTGGQADGQVEPTNFQSWDEYWTYEYEYLKISTRVQYF